MIWGTVLTTLVSNLLIPGIYVVPRPGDPPADLPDAGPWAPPGRGRAAGRRHLGLPPGRPHRAAAGATLLVRSLPLLAHLTVGCLAYLAGYLLVPAGRGDLAALARKLRLRGA